MNYKVTYHNIIENGIDETNELVDNISIFKKFTAAKRALLKILKAEKAEINNRLRQVSAYTLSDVK